VRKAVDTGKSLNALLGWKTEKGPFPTPLVEKVNAALDVPLKDLKWPQVRLLIGQNIGLEFLMPWAIGAVTKRPLYCAELYDGDLLVTCLRVERDYWIAHMDQWHAMSSVLGQLDSAMKHIGDARGRFENEAFQP
jgi:CDI immunity proteins